jgi:hypothetical protein
MVAASTVATAAARRANARNLDGSGKVDTGLVAAPAPQPDEQSAERARSDPLTHGFPPRHTHARDRAAGLDVHLDVHKESRAATPPAAACLASLYPAARRSRAAACQPAVDLGERRITRATP